LLKERAGTFYRVERPGTFPEGTFGLRLLKPQPPPRHGVFVREMTEKDCRAHKQFNFAGSKVVAKCILPLSEGNLKWRTQPNIFEQSRKVGQMISRKLASSLLVGSICLLTSNGLLADMLIQEIKNTSAITTANDLTLRFSQEIPVGRSAISITDKDNNTKTFTVTESGTRFTFGVGELPSNFGPGATAKIKFTAPKGTMIDKSMSFWTEDNAMIIGALASLGAPPSIDFSDGVAFALFTDPDSVPITYTDITASLNADPTTFNLDQFDMPTGKDLVTVLFSPITVVDADHPVLLTLGSVIPGDYELVTATAATVSNPSDTFSVGSAALVPEPSMFPLLGLCFLAVMSRRFFI